MYDLDIKTPKPKGRVVKCKGCGKVYDLGELTPQRHVRNKCPYCGMWQLYEEPKAKAQRLLKEKLERAKRPISYEADAFRECPARQDVYGLTDGVIVKTNIAIEKNLLHEIKRRAKANGRSMSEEIQRVLYVHYAEIIAEERIAKNQN